MLLDICCQFRINLDRSLLNHSVCFWRGKTDFIPVDGSYINLVREKSTETHFQSYGC